ncbi:pyrroline-5-carboxylate reductase [Natronincola peptidivorans]|uniref:Pyrroline-5-carboxylate reductase n=1 Tax=Natronincola peptidivorans TaxID=426128 RepID=A0A1I0FN23_9FIRM|nr:pyrroline-5-carboxylate reductase [Natronincola peptidivorans]SET58676.1 pyrroline-5-carboxylate reductase [Natronincola peptidivorans]
MKLGFIGCGNMAQAMMGGIIAGNLIPADEIIASDGYKPSLEKTKENLGIHITMDNKEVAVNSELIVLSIKPQFYDVVIKEIAPIIKEDTIIITIAPGKTLEDLENQFGKKVKIVRTMPNTPAMVGEGMTAMCANDLVAEKEMKEVKGILEGFGRVEMVPEYVMDAVVAVSGSSPAYVFMFIEALADGAVLQGMDRAQARIFAAQSVLGSAKMVLETKLHPAELKDMVCSPAGTTIEAVKTLEDRGFRSAVIQAMDSCAKRCKDM